LREAGRNRGRTAPAVAAVLAAVAGTVAVATYAVSDDRQQRDAYEARLPYGSAVVRLDAEGGRDLGAVRTAVEKHLPVAARADVERPVTGRKVCDMRSEEHTSELQSRGHLVCRLLLEKKKRTRGPLV